MCESNAYLLKNGEEELLMEAVDIIEPEENGYRLIGIFGDQKIIRGRLKIMNLVNHRIVFEAEQD
jgi:predicted RNA-binding protein